MASLATAGALLLLAAFVGAVPAQAASSVGKPCPRPGATDIDPTGRPLVCARVTKGKDKGRLRWKLAKGPKPTSGIPSVIETWGIDLTPYDATTKKAGELYVGSIPFPAGSVIQAPIQYYGEGPRRPTDPPGFVDPQMTFIVPQGTPVKAIASGTVCWMKYLNTGYSDDYSIGIGVAVNDQPPCQWDPRGDGFGTVATWEHEHVMEPRVKAGDTVKAGDVIATASYYSPREWMYAAGYALYEIGILTQSPDGRPMHVCPALYLAPAAKQRLLTELATAARAFEANAGSSAYAPQTLATGCITEKPAYG